MALISSDRSFIDVPVSDRTHGVKQRARWRTMIVNQHPATGELTLQLETEAMQYADNNGSYGEPLTGKGIIAYPVPLRGDNNTAVDPTGQLRYLRVTEAIAPSSFMPAGRVGQVLNLLSGQVEEIAPDQTWQTFLDAKPEQLLLQGDWFAGLMKQMGITQLIQQFMEQADQPPFSKFT